MRVIEQVTSPIDTDKYNYEFGNIMARGPIASTLNRIISWVFAIIYFIRWILMLIFWWLVGLVGISLPSVDFA